MKLLTATLVKNPRSVTTKYGPKIVADCKLDNGEEVTLWQPENSQIINYDNGSKLTLTLDSKGKYHWVESENEVGVTVTPTKTETNQTQYQGMSNETKKQVASYITEMSNLFNFCLKQVDQTIENITPDDRRAIATTLFVSAQKKYSL
jgi:UDP-N-acetylmuramyl tripeptide synthase